MRCVSVAGSIVAVAVHIAVGQNRTDLVNRFGPPQSETFLLPQNLKLTATYDQHGAVCALRLETRDHSIRAAPNLTDPKYWTDSQEITRLVSELVPESSRRGPVRVSTVGLRVGEHMRVESDDSVEITRIQRSRPLLTTSEVPAADRLVKVSFKRPGCRDED